MDVKVLKDALHNPKINEESTENARSAAVSARQETRDTVSRMDDRVQLDVAKAVGATVKLEKCDAAPEE
jgi:phage anti-repressor protein